MARTDDDYNKWDRRRNPKPKRGNFPNEKGLRGSEAKDKNDPFEPPKKTQSQLYDAFFERIEKAIVNNEERPYIDSFLVPIEELIAVRNKIKTPTLFNLDD